MEKADLERRRKMTDAERIEEDRKLGRFDEKTKEKWRFMQKYYHKGVFYMDKDSLKADDVRLKDFSAPTLEDNFNKEALPQVLQVKNFGKRGRTKYTHLLDQDTSSKGASRLLGQGVDERVKESYMRKLGGVGDLDSAGRWKRRKNDDDEA